MVPAMSAIPSIHRRGRGRSVAYARKSAIMIRAWVSDTVESTSSAHRWAACNVTTGRVRCVLACTVLTFPRRRGGSLDATIR